MNSTSNEASPLDLKNENDAKTTNSCSIPKFLRLDAGGQQGDQ